MDEGDITSTELVKVTQLFYVVYIICSEVVYFYLFGVSTLYRSYYHDG